ncbi:ABC transporter permease [Bosea sp. (in: a-proteobacteria)]|uniref:ABC transporter permease n=1 Tax=Bosea sp. (in: a-proteobacteria) TaxID=1871050 RepID=UPI002623F699|nr:ABC transporter permease [Bosea sp. (in: a-proteobacteria)]MCO5089587.1 ABC transporter permease [Bosea sp. (in: a-proteobacteria)]
MSIEAPRAATVGHTVSGGAETAHPRHGTAQWPVVLLLLLPATLLFFMFFIVPLCMLVLNSFYGYSRLSGIVPVLSLDNYVAIFTDSYNISIIGRTLRLGLLTSVLTLLLGYPVALYLSIAPSYLRGFIILMVLSPLLVSVVVRTFGWLIILGPNGLIDTAFSALGIPIPPILHTEAAVVIGLANVLLPFLVLSVATSLQAIDPAVPLAASSLGANAWRVFWHVTLPLTLPGIMSGLLIVFSLASSSFVTPSLLGGSNYSVLSTTIYEQAMVMQNWPSAASFAVALVLIVFLVLLVQSRFVEGGKFKVVFH